MVSALTGCTAHYYPRFTAERNGVRLQEEMRRVVVRTHGYEGTMRVRTSAGLNVADQFGAFYMKNATDIELASIDSDKGNAYFMTRSCPY